MDMKTILFVGNYFKSDRSNQNVWFEIPERLEQVGWEKIITSQKVARSIRLADMLWTIFSKRKSYDLALVDVFSGAAFTWAEMAARLLKRLNKPFVLNLHGGNLPQFAEKYPEIVGDLLGSADRAISPSPYLSNELKGFRKDIQVIPNPILIEEFPYRHRENLKPNLIWVRAFHEIYNPSLAPKVLKILMEDLPEVQMTMVGPDKGDGSLGEMKKIAERLGVIDQIQLTGGVPGEKVPGYLFRGEIFINTTNVDNTPLSVIEAMACGLPIVTTNVGGIPWLVDDGVDGLLVPPDDPQAMADAVERILTDRALAGKLSQNARKKAENFDWSIILPQWDSLFESLIEDESKRR